MDKSLFTVVSGSDDQAETFTPEKRNIFEVKTFTDDEGRMVSGHFPIEDIDSAFYVGSFMVQTNMGPMRMNIDFPEGSNIEQCFYMFDELAQKTLKEAQEEAQERNRIVTPDQFKGNFKI
jgi:hypothetical protein